MADNLSQFVTLPGEVAPSLAGGIRATSPTFFDTLSRTALGVADRFLDFELQSAELQLAREQQRTINSQLSADEQRRAAFVETSSGGGTIAGIDSRLLIVGGLGLAALLLLAR